MRGGGERAYAPALPCGGVLVNRGAFAGISMGAGGGLLMFPWSFAWRALSRGSAPQSGSESSGSSGRGRGKSGRSKKRRKEERKRRGSDKKKHTKRGKDKGRGREEVMAPARGTGDARGAGKLEALREERRRREEEERQRAMRLMGGGGPSAPEVSERERPYNSSFGFAPPPRK